MKICDFKWSELNQKVETPAISKNLTIEKKTIPVFFIENKIFELFDGEDFYEIFTQKLKQFVKEKGITMQSIINGVKIMNTICELLVFMYVFNMCTITYKLDNLCTA